MAEDQSFQELMARLRTGDQEAASRIFEQFARRLVGLARARLSSQLRAKVDPDDVVQSVFRSFFVRQAQGEFELPGWSSLWSLLAVITLRKCGHRVEHYRAACRDIQRELPATMDSDSAAGWQAIARDPSPSEAAVLAETVENLMNSLSERDRRILELSLQGQKVGQISEQVGCTERTVERVLERVRQRLERMSSSADRD